MVKSKRRKHLFSKSNRDPKTGYCVTSLWGPFCEICRENFEKNLTKALKGIDIKEALRKIKPKLEKELKELSQLPKPQTGILPHDDEEYRKHMIRENSKNIRY